MKKHFLEIQTFILIILLNICYNQDSQNKITFKDNSFYYEEKYFRILSNNYETIDPGNMWNKDDEDGYGFIAKKDFGSLILLKDWSMYNFKLTKILFKNRCSLDYENNKCDAEMWLIHTKDNGYYPPGRRIFIKQNYFVIVIPFVKTSDSNPAIDSIFEALRLSDYAEDLNKNVSPSRPVKLHQIIQNQPSFLFEGKYKNKEILFLVFSQYHYISDTDHNNLVSLYNKRAKNLTDIEFDNENTDYGGKIFRNVRNIEEITPKLTLMSYSKAKYLENILFFIMIFLF